jgi:hypothetical protein
MDPRLDVNFSTVIAQRAAECKARRYENPAGLEFNSNGLPPSTTFFNNCVTTNGVPQQLTTNGKFKSNEMNEVINSFTYFQFFIIIVIEINSFINTKKRIILCKRLMCVLYGVYSLLSRVILHDR